jgi:hypothetical protein
MPVATLTFNSKNVIQRRKFLRERKLKKNMKKVTESSERKKINEKITGICQVRPVCLPQKYKLCCAY